MTTQVLPTLDALRSNDDSRLESELRLAAIRTQTAVVRALMDDVERFSGVPLRAPLDQLVDEMARLGCSALATASALASIPGA